MCSDTWRAGRAPIRKGAAASGWACNASAPGRTAFQFFMNRTVAGQKASVQQGEAGKARPFDGLQALSHCKHRGIDSQTCVPKQADHFRQQFLERVALLVRFQKEHQIQFGMRKGLAQAIRAAGQQRQ